MSGRKKAKKWKHPVLESWGEEASMTTPPPTVDLTKPSTVPSPPQISSSVCSSSAETVSIESKDDQKSSTLETESQVCSQEDEDPVRTKEKDITDVSDRDTVGQTRVESKTTESPPPPHRVVKEAVPLKTLLCDRPMLGNVADQLDGSRDDVRPDELELSQNKEDITISDRKTKNITINGIDLTEYMKRKNKEVKKMTPDRKKKPPKEGRNRKNSTPSSEENQNTLLKYIVRKKDNSQEACVSRSKTMTMNDISALQCDNVTGDRGHTDPGVRDTTDQLENMSVKKTFACMAAMRGVSVSDRVRDEHQRQE